MLATSLKAVLSKRKSVVVGVWGEAGVGKTYTLAQQLRALPCRSLSVHATLSLSDLAKSVPKAKNLSSKTAHVLARLEAGGASELPAVINAFGAALAALAPFVLHLEDSHEATPERLGFIQKLAQVVLLSKGVGLITTSRKLPPKPFQAIRLEPLSRDQSDLLITNEIGATLPEDALLWIYAKAAGNPLYTLEYVRYLSRQGLL